MKISHGRLPGIVFIHAGSRPGGVNHAREPTPN
jgi:hypothetical protein